jgi:outer membrane receptor protein involved in Fe transport
VYSSYASFSISLGKYNFRAGSRVEQTIVEGEFKHSKTTVDQDYLNWLPSFLVSRKLNKIHTISLSYTKRLSRPFIWDLNPFVNNTDSLTIYSGNPHLQTEIYHAGELGYLLVMGQTTVNIRLSETFSSNQIVRYSSFNDNTGITNWKSDNLGKYSSTGLSGNINLSLTSKWRISSNLGLRYDFIKNQQNNAQKNQGFGGYGNLNTSIELNKKVTVYINGNISRSPALLQGFYGVNYSYNAGSNIKFFNNKLTLIININNFIMKHINWRSEFNDKNFHTVINNVRPARAANIGLRWNFGKLTENVSRKRGITNDDLKGNSN